VLGGTVGWAQPELRREMPTGFTDSGGVVSDIFHVGLDANRANYAPLTPLAFLDWSADVYPDRLAVVHGPRRFTWAQTRERCQRLAAALAARSVGRGDTVSVVAANTPEMVEVHFGVPMTGAVLNTINTRLDAATIAYILDHAQARVLITDREFSPAVAAALRQAQVSSMVIDIDDPEYDGPGDRLGTKTTRSCYRRRRRRMSGPSRRMSGRRSH
jgi:fatty-acyl-CoA synthase